ncbi:MAG: hypothetical protein ACFE7R_09805, partial [Candidatus Hodarchaeota archaeon]
MNGSVKIPQSYLQSWHRSLSEISRKQPGEFPLRVLDLREEIKSISESTDELLLNIPVSKLESWSNTLNIYVDLASEHFLLPPSLSNLARRITQQMSRLAEPHIRYTTEPDVYIIQEVNPHYYGGYELTLTDEDATEVDLFPLASCRELKRLWLAVD